jgi:hypothetical protein
MTKLISIAFLTALLAACSSMGMHSSSMGNGADTQHSTDSAAAKNGNPAAVSPGGK